MCARCFSSVLCFRILAVLSPRPSTPNIVAEIDNTAPAQNRTLPKEWAVDEFTQRFNELPHLLKELPCRVSSAWGAQGLRDES